MATDVRDQLVKYLTDAHSIEEQALQQLRDVPDAAGDEELARIFREHCTETEGHERAMRERLEAHGAKPPRLKEVVMRAGGTAVLLFARSQPDTPGKLTAHAFSYEHLELASYELLLRVAERAGDSETAAAARRIRDEERGMAERLAGAFDRAVEASLAELETDDLREQLVKYLADAHAIEAQALALLDRGQSIAGEPQLAGLYADHRGETEEHQRLLDARLQALDAKPSRLKDAAMRLGALNWGMFFQAQPDTPGKLAAFAYAFEHLEIGGYEELRRVAERAGDWETVELADRILGQERAMAERVAASFDAAVEASLRAQEVAA
jgi:ferritin-like metal-binding protein YciE